MANYFYTDESGQRQGPIDDQTLRLLVAQKRIQPETPLETESGHTGLAGQIPGLFPATPAPAHSYAQPVPMASAPKQAFCTNCGNAVAEKVVACMSCGAKPFGHKVFCRSCGVALNPGQVVCTRCGAAVGGGMPDLSKIGGALTSPHTMKWLLPTAIGIGAVLAILAVWFWVLPIIPGIGGGGSNPLRSAKAGDYARYSIANTYTGHDGREITQGRQRFKTEVISNRGGRVKLKFTGVSMRDLGIPLREVPGFINDKGEIEITIALKKSPVETLLSFWEFNMSELDKIFPENPIKKSIRIKREKNSTESVDVGDQSIKCTVKTYTITATAPGGDEKTTTTIKEWTSSRARGCLLVKMEMKVKYDHGTQTTTTIELAEFGNEK